MGNVCLKDSKTLEGIDFLEAGGQIQARGVSQSSEQESRPAVQDASGLNWERIVKTEKAANLKNLQDDLDTNPTLFLLNNIALSVQFLKNFERDKDEVQKTKETLKTEMDERLAGLKKNCIIPPSVLSKVHEYVSYKSEEGYYEPLVNDEYILCFNNIEVDREENFERIQDEAEHIYTNLDNPTYRVCIEKSSHPGYVHVRCVDDYSKLDRTASSEKALENGHNGSLLDPSLKENGIRPSSGSYLEIEPVPQLAPSPTPSLKKQLAFKDVIEEDEEEEEDGEDEVTKLHQLIGANNYIMKQEFGPSQRETRKMNHEPPMAQIQNRLQERRPSGVLPMSYMNMTKKEDEFKKRMHMQEKKKKNKLQVNKRQPTVHTEELNHKSDTVLEEGDENYDYVSLKRVPLNVSENTRTSRGSLIPENCFEDKDVPLVENGENDPYPLNAETERRHYLSSKGMMSYFTEQFPSICDKLEKELFKDPDNSRVFPPDIFCQEMAERKMFIWKFSPSIQCGFWPDEGYEYRLRKRSVMRDKRTGVEYQWPSQEQIAAVQTLGFNIAPKGFTFPRKEHVNQDSDIEWEMKFTKADLYISRNLHHPKLRVYIFSLILFKAFLEPFEGINEQHFRYIFYWLVERSPGDWTEENVGEKVKLIMEYLKKHLTKQKMPHYFLSKCNMFANIANHRLRAAQEKVYRILENPVVYFLQSISNIHYEKNFYPKMDAKKLFRILTDNNLLAKSLNVGATDPSITGSLATIPKEVKPKGDRYQMTMREEQKKREEKEKMVNEAKESRRPAKNPIDVDATLPARLDELRKRYVLEFFIEHFLKMAEKSNIFRAYGQGYMYTQHADNLLILLSKLGYEGSKEYNSFQENLFRLKQNNEAVYDKDYWNIAYSHPKLTHSSSFRSTDISSISLPSLPEHKASPIPGTEMNGVTVSIDVHSPVAAGARAGRERVVGVKGGSRDQIQEELLEEDEEDNDDETDEKSSDVWDRIDIGFSVEESDDFDTRL